MDSFSLLKYWKPSTSAAADPITLPPEPPTDDDETDDDGPFFDLEFSVPEDSAAQHLEDGEQEKDFNFSMNSSDSNTVSPSDDLFFKGQLVPLESNSIVISAEDTTDPKTQLAVSLLKSATKFRVFILGLRKSKSTAVESNAPKQSQMPGKFFFVKFKVEEVPIVSLFTRDGSARNQGGDAKGAVEKITEIDAGEDIAVVAPAASEKTKPSNSKEVVQKYLSKIKPLYVRVSKRYADKLRFSGPLVHGGVPGTELSSEEEKEAEAEEPGEMKMAEKNLMLAVPAKLKVVYERLGKSKTAASAVAAVSSPPAAPQRRDDSLLQQQDGIQSAIAHCKRSFTATSKETESPLQLSKSNPGAECV